MKRTGTIYTYSVVHSAAEAFKERTPYVVALVDENGHRVVSLLEGYDPTRQVEIGQEVAGELFGKSKTCHDYGNRIPTHRLSAI